MDAEMDAYWMKSGDKKIAGKVRPRARKRVRTTKKERKESML